MRLGVAGGGFSASTGLHSRIRCVLASVQVRAVNSMCARVGGIYHDCRSESLMRNFPYRKAINIVIRE